jgi:hypothetical protein
MKIGNGETKVRKTKQGEWEDKGFCFQYNQLVTMPDSATANKYFLFDPTGVDGDIWLHVFPLTFTNVEDGPVVVNYYAGSNYSGGTPLPLLNRNGRSAAAPATVVTEDPTGTVLGTRTSANKVAKGGALPSQSGGGNSGLNLPFIANNTTTFLIEIVNTSGITVTGEIYFEVCEVPSGFN